MVFKKGEVTNPQGNPNIGELSKIFATGPRTPKGKFKASMSVLKHGLYSKILDEIQKCNNCPLKAVTLPNGVEIKKCQFYERDKENCPVGKEEFIATVKFYDMIEKKGETEAMKYIASQQYASAVLAAQAEIATKRHPGFYTSDFLKNAVDTLDRVQKAKQGDRHVNINVDVTQQFLRDVFRMPDDDFPEEKEEEKDEEEKE